MINRKIFCKSGPWWIKMYKAGSRNLHKGNGVLTWYTHRAAVIGAAGVAAAVVPVWSCHGESRPLSRRRRTPPGERTGHVTPPTPSPSWNRGHIRPPPTRTSAPPPLPNSMNHSLTLNPAEKGAQCLWWWHPGVEVREGDKCAVIVPTRQPFIYLSICQSVNTQLGLMATRSHRWPHVRVLGSKTPHGVVNLPRG